MGFECMNNLTPDSVSNFNIVQKFTKETSDKGVILRCPSAVLATGQRAFTFHGVKKLNYLHKDIRGKELVKKKKNAKNIFYSYSTS